MKTAEEVVKIVTKNNVKLIEAVDKILSSIVENALRTNAINPTFHLTEGDINSVAEEYSPLLEIGEFTLRSEIISIAKNILGKNKYEIIKFDDVTETDASRSMLARIITFSPKTSKKSKLRPEHLLFASAKGNGRFTVLPAQLATV